MKNLKDICDYNLVRNKFEDKDIQEEIKNISAEDQEAINDKIKELINKMKDDDSHYIVGFYKEFVIIALNRLRQNDFRIYVFSDYLTFEPKL